MDTMDKLTVKESELEPGITALRLTTDQFSVTVAPQLGGKIVSLVNRKTRREFAARSNVTHRLRTLDGRFEDYERDGIDDCFPSVAGAPFPVFPWQGAPIPDHGEVWALPWEYQIKPDRLITWVRGVRLPYRFERQISFETLARKEKPFMRLSYKVENDSPYDMPFLYAFHALFKAETRTRVLLPAGTNVVSSWSTEDRLGPPMTLQDWPKVTDLTLDKSYDRSAIRSSRNKEAEKLFTTPLDQGRCALVYPNGEFIGFLFPAKKLPFLGLWFNEGGWNNLHQVALEPTTSQVDRVDAAEGLKTCGVVPAKGSYEWDISIIAGKGEELTSLLGEF